MFAPKPRGGSAPGRTGPRGRFGFVEKENRPANPCGHSPELRKRLVDARAHTRLLEQKQQKALQDLKVENMIQSAIQKKENEFLRQQNMKLQEQVQGASKQVVQREHLIQNLKGRIATMVRKPRRLHGRSRLNVLDESSCLSVCSLDESRIEERRSMSREPEGLAGELRSLSREPEGEREPREPPVPTATPVLERAVAFDGAPAVQTYVVPPGSGALGPRTHRRSWTKDSLPSQPKDSPEPTRMHAETPMSDMSVEKHVDRVNERLHALLQTGSEALHPPEAAALDDTMRTERTGGDVSELHSVLVPLNDTLFERNELIPFLERTSEDLRDAEEAVRGLDQDLEALSDVKIAAEVNTLRTDNNALRGQLEELMDRMLAGADAVRQSLPAPLLAPEPAPLTARSFSAHTAPSPGVRARSTSPPPLAVPWRRPSHPTRAPSSSRLAAPRCSPRDPQEATMLRRGANGATFLKVGETRTERWVMLPDGAAGRAPMLSHVPAPMVPPSRAAR